MAYRNLSPQEVIEVILRMEEQDDIKHLKTYTTWIHDQRQGRDVIVLPDSHKGLLQEESHKGSRKFNSTVQDARNWAVLRDVWFRVTPESEEPEARAAAGRMTQFLGGMFQELRYQGQRDTLTEVVDDMLMGFGVRRQNPRAEYFRDWARIVEAEDLSDDEKREQLDAMIEERRDIKNVWVSDRVPPMTYRRELDPDGELLAAGEVGPRSVGSVAQHIGLEEAKRMTGMFDFGPAVNEDAGKRSGAQILVAELWVEDRGYLVWMDGLTFSGSTNTASQTRVLGQKLTTAIEPEGRIIAEWPNVMGKVPYYERPVTPFPWESPLDEMAHAVNEFNYWDTLRQVQLHAGTLRQFTLVRTPDPGNTPQPVLDDQDRPRTITLKAGQALPHMGPGFEWQLTPFEEMDVESGYQNARQELVEAGDLAKALSGATINQNTAVGTASMLFNSAQRGLSPMIRSEARAMEQEAKDFCVWLRDVYQEEVTLQLSMEPEVGEDGVQTRTIRLKPDDIVTLNIEVLIRPMLPVDQAADLAKAKESVEAGLKTIDGVIELGWVPGETDPERFKDKMWLSKLEAGMAEVDLTIELQRYEELQRGGPRPMTPEEMQQRGGLVDQFGNPLQAGQGNRAPMNVRDTGLASGDGNIQRQGSVGPVQ